DPERSRSGSRSRTRACKGSIDEGPCSWLRWKVTRISPLSQYASRAGSRAAVGDALVRRTLERVVATRPVGKRVAELGRRRAARSQMEQQRVRQRHGRRARGDARAQELHGAGRAGGGHGQDLDAREGPERALFVRASLAAANRRRGRAAGFL